MIKLTIDGKTFETESGKMIIEVADNAGIPIPRFCYHKKLSIAANCRMCLVDVEKVPKPLPACATPVSDGMVVNTQSAKALDAQRTVMEFLLINHPLDCPICDQGGECELQDLAMGYGKSVSRYAETKRSVAEQDIGPLVQTDMTRCIHCTRCVRFGDEILGLPQLGTMGRGEKTKISTYVSESLKTPLSGNIIDLCPVGALTSKPFRYQARAWEMEESLAYSPHDALGSHLYLHRRRNEVLRVVPKSCETLNEVWLSDRDRFSYLGLSHADRLTSPLAKDPDGNWREVDWSYALNTLADALKKIIAVHGADKALGAIISPNATLEELSLFQRLFRALGSNNIDHRLRAIDCRDQAAFPLFPNFAISLDDLASKKAILLIAADPIQEIPILAHRIRQAALQGTACYVIHSKAYDALETPIAAELCIKPSEIPQVLLQILKYKVEQANTTSNLPENLKDYLSKVTVEENTKTFLTQLPIESIHICLGEFGYHHPEAALIRYLLQWIVDLSTDTTVGYLTPGANAAGAWLAAAVPHRDEMGKAIETPGLSTTAMWQSELPAYCLYQVEPELDCANAPLALQALEKADFVCSFTTYATDTMKSYADLLLPIAPFTETAGTFVNMFGHWQSFQGAVQPLGSTRPGWKVLAALGQILGLTGFDIQHAFTLRDLLQQSYIKQYPALSKTMPIYEKTAFQMLPPYKNTKKGLECFSTVSLYRADPLVRRASALQTSALTPRPTIAGNLSLLKKYGLQENQAITVKQGNLTLTLPFRLMPELADDTLYIPMGFEETKSFDGLFGEVELMTVTI